MMKEEGGGVMGERAGWRKGRAGMMDERAGWRKRMAREWRKGKAGG